MRVTKNVCKGVLLSAVLATGGVLAADGGRTPAPRPGLFWEESWTMATPGEHPVTQADVVNPFLQLKIYGMHGEEGLQINGEIGSDANPPHTWSGVCGYGCTFAFGHRDRYADLSGAARISVQTKTSGFHKVRPYIRLADGTTLVGDLEIVQPSDFLFTEFRPSDVRWMAFDTETAVTRGVLLNDVDLGRVDEVGFTDLQPGAGHGQGGWTDVGAIRVYANSVPR